MKSFTFTNSIGESVVIKGATFPFNLISFEGTGAPDVNNHFKKSPFEDGQTFVGNDLDMRYVDLTFSVLAHTEGQLNEDKRKVVSVCNPRLGIGVLKYEYEGDVKEVPCVSEGVKFSYTKDPLEQSSQVTFAAPDPYWLDLVTESEPMEAYLGLFKFPLTFPVKMGEQGSKQTFINAGDVPTPIYIEFNGVATNPRIQNNTTGEFIQVNQTVLSGEKMIIDTAKGNKRRVEIIGTDGTARNVINWIDLNSDFFQLQRGENEIEYSTADNEDVSSLVIKWRNRYLGV
jgi:Phage tail protein